MTRIKSIDDQLDNLLDDLQHRSVLSIIKQLNAEPLSEGFLAGLSSAGETYRQSLTRNTGNSLCECGHSTYHHSNLVSTRPCNLLGCECKEFKSNDTL
jgi:hypothetical protein